MTLIPSPDNSSSPPNRVITRCRLLTLAGAATAEIVLESCSFDAGAPSAAIGPEPTPSTSITLAPAPTTVTSTLPPEVTTASRRALLSIPQQMSGSTFDLDVGIGTREFVPGVSTPTKGYNGDFLGSTLFVRSGTDVALNVTNNIGVTTTTHWYGMHVPAVMDGGPHQPIEPGETWSAAFRVLNRAGTYWYHPHNHAGGARETSLDPESTGYQVYEGLAGLLIVEDETSDSLELPRSYGRDDIPLILQDRDFGDDGQNISLMSFNAENGTSFVPSWLQDEWDRNDFELLKINVGPANADAVMSIPTTLVDVVRIAESEAVNADRPRQFRLTEEPFQINGSAMDMDTINERVTLSDTEVWEISNPNFSAHPFHVHGDSFRILSRDGETPPDHELG